MRQQSRQRISDESAEQRDVRVLDMRQRAQQRRSDESDVQQQTRLQSVCQHAQQQRLSESDDHRAQRLCMRERLPHREGSCSNAPHARITKNQYLHQGGWTESGEKLHKQLWVQEEMMTFHKKQTLWEHRLCTVCHDLWPTRTSLQENQDTYVCTRCKHDKRSIKKF